MKILVRNGESEKWELADAVVAEEEAELQSLLIESPFLIPVDEMRGDAEPLVFAVGEFGLPGSGRTDIVAFSPAGDIVVIECKLAANSEAKRKVIGQILEYGAYLWGMSYKEVDDHLRGKMGASLVDLVDHAIGGEWDETLFRNSVEAALDSGAFLLTIVVDQVNPELRRIIRYVNECSQSVFSLHALEMRRFEAAGVQMLVPHVFGVSASGPGGEDKRSGWTENGFFERLGMNVDAGLVEATRNLYEWTLENADRVYRATGADRWSFTFHYLPGGKTASVFTVYTDGKFQLNYGWLVEQVDRETIEEFHERVTGVPVFREVPAEFSGKWPKLELEEVLRSQEQLNRFKEAAVWLGRAVEANV